MRLSANQAVLGGTTQGPGYTLTQAEANRIRSQTLRILAPAADNAPGAPDLLIRDLTLSPTVNSSGGAVNRFEASVQAADGILEVGGNLLLANAGTNDGIFLDGGGIVRIVNPAGSVRVRDAGGLPGGTLDIAAANIWSASQTILDQLFADPNFAGRDLALLQNSGPVEPRGYIEAHEVTLSASGTILVQNSGGPANFAGITVRQNTLTLVPTGTEPLDVYAFGRRINPDGSFVTGKPFFDEVAFDAGQTAAGYTERAQFNACFINTGICPQIVFDEFSNGRDIITQPVYELPLLQPGEEQDLVDTSFAADALVEEPVTSGGDTTMWSEQCDTDGDGDCDADDRRQ